MFANNAGSQVQMVPLPDHLASAGPKIIFNYAEWCQPINIWNALGTNSTAKIQAIAQNLSLDFDQKMFLESSFRKHFSDWI